MFHALKHKKLLSEKTFIARRKGKIVLFRTYWRKGKTYGTKILDFYHSTPLRTPVFTFFTLNSVNGGVKDGSLFVCIGKKIYICI